MRVIRLASSLSQGASLGLPLGMKSREKGEKFEQDSHGIFGRGYFRAFQIIVKLCKVQATRG